MASESHLQARVALRRIAAEPSFSLDVAVDFGPGLSVLFGPSGSGKTTLLSALAGLLRPDAGHVRLAGRVLFDADAKLDLPPNERRIALVFQSLALFPHLDALENVAYGVPRDSVKKERRALAHTWLERMQVAHLARRFPHSYSGGEAQRVALARALASEPSALLLDEPFSALDRHLASELSAQLSEYVSSVRLPVVLVTHDRGLARALGAELTLLNGGRVERTGLAREMLAEPENPA
ncbi:MAG: ATP-binding cassette domain-containing protein [Pseudomonadota bacterium]